MTGISTNIFGEFLKIHEIEIQKINIGSKISSMKTVIQWPPKTYWKSHAMRDESLKKPLKNRMKVLATPPIFLFSLNIISLVYCISFIFLGYFLFNFHLNTFILFYVSSLHITILCIFIFIILFLSSRIFFLLYLINMILCYISNERDNEIGKNNKLF